MFEIYVRNMYALVSVGSLAFKHVNAYFILGPVVCKF